MSKTIAIFGAGTVLGISAARRFGREGYQVALIGRRAPALGALVDDLMEEGINAAAFPADLAQTSSVPELIRSISIPFGGIDVVAYSPATANSFLPANELTADVMQSYLNLYLLTPIEIVRQDDLSGPSATRLRMVNFSGTWQKRRSGRQFPVARLGARSADTAVRSPLWQSHHGGRFR